MDLPGPPRIGFASIWADLFRTDDGGSTWTKVASDLGDVSDYTFKDSLTGWCALRYDPRAILVTYDGGRTWSPATSINTFGSAEGIYYNKKSQRLFLATWYHGLYYSADNGNSWLEIGPDRKGYSGFAFHNDSVGIVSVVDQENSFLRTSDAGLSWTPVGFSQECWQPLGIATNTFMAACEGRGNGLNRSDDGGKTWGWIPAKNLGYITGDIEGTSCRLYIQTWSDGAGPNGMHRSLDEGLSWEFLGGPFNMFDRRFFVKDRHLYAGDSLGNIWYLYDTIGTTYSASLNLSIPSVAFDSIPPCAHPRIPIIVENWHLCDEITIKNVTLSPPFTLLPFSLPRDVPPGTKDTIWVEYSGATSGPANADLVITTKYENLTHEKVIPVSGVRTGAGRSKVITSAASVILPQITVCSPPVDTTISLRNFGCDTIIVTEIPGSLPSGYGLLSPDLPFILLPDSTLLITLYFIPSVPGTFRSYPKLKVQLPSGPQEFEFYFEINVAPGEGQLAVYPPSFTIPDLSICNTDSVVGFYTNTGCDSLEIESVSISGDLDFTGQFPKKTLAPGDTVFYVVRLNPTTKGLRSSVILIQSKTLTGNRNDTSILVQATVLDGLRILSSSSQSLDFGSKIFCDELDTVLRLVNDGCDTVTVSGADLTGLGFSLSVKSFPLIIPPDQFRELEIKTLGDTTGGLLLNEGQIILISNSDNKLPPVLLTRQHIYPRTYDLSVTVVEPEGTASEFVSLQLLAGNWWQTDNVMHGVQRLDFDLAMNSDLLHFVSASGANRVTGDGRRVTVEGNPEIVAPGGVLAEFVYQVHLTKDMMTDIVLSNLTLNNGDPTPCKPTILGNGTGGFTYRYVCGDRAIQTFLRTGKAIDITSIRPNPANDEISIDLKSNSEGPINVEVFDALGKLVLDQHLERAALVVMPVGALSPGSYVFRVTQADQTVSNQFVIER